jgi:hypothetical protein
MDNPEKSNIYIKGTHGNQKMCPYIVFIYRLKLYALFMNGKMRLAFIDSDLLKELSCSVVLGLILYLDYNHSMDYLGKR